MIVRRQLVIAISTERVTVAHWRGRSIVEPFEVDNTDEGIAACRAALGRCAEASASILVDAV